MWRVYPDEGCYDIPANGALVYPSLPMLKVAWYWGRDCCVINDLHGEPGHTPFYVDLPSMWGFVDGDQMCTLLVRHIKV